MLKFISEPLSMVSEDSISYVKENKVEGRLL
jgi:hypothetical protein